MTTRRCSKCGEEKDISCFVKDRQKTSGYHSHCKTCIGIKNQKWRERPGGMVSRMVESARKRAAQKGVPFDLTVDDISIPDRCPILGIPLYKGTGRLHDNSPSLDRIIPSQGYVPWNVAVISNRANIIKNNATPEELEAIAAFIRKHIDELLKKEGH